MTEEQVLKTGTTTIGLVCKDGIILAADKRITAGHSIVGGIKKVLPVGKRFAITIAGTASDALMLTRHLRAEIRLKELRSQNEVTVREAANLLAQFVFSNVRRMSVIPGITHFLFAGHDKDGVALYDVFPDGTSTLIENYFCSGSGSVYAYGLIDGSYDKEMSVEEGAKLAKKAIRSAMIRDSASGNGYDIIAITKDGVKEIESVEFSSQIEK